MNKKWTLWAGLILILVVFILIWQFAPAIQRWLANVFIDIIVLALTFAAGWLLGRYGGRRNRNRDQENARNITEAQETVTLRLRISPCPNDTFMFDALLNGRIDTGGLHFDVEYRDIEALNRGVQAGEADVSKISCAVLPAVADRYALLDSGAALGRGNGPLLVRRAGDRSPIRRVAVPGVHTTANALMMRLFPRITERTPLLFSQIAAAVERGDFDAGVLIHEGRFVYRQRQLELVADLGQLWERTTALPLPLGGIAAKRSLPEAVRRQVETLIRQSIEYAFAHPEASRAYIKEHAQELDDAVIDAHIALFVNDYSLSLGDEGRRAVEALTGIACAFNS